MTSLTGESPFLVVAVANGDYASLDALPDVTPNASAVTATLRDHHGYRTIELLNQRRGDLQDHLEKALAAGSLPGGSLIVLWSGHGQLNEANGLELMARATDQDDGVVFMAERLGQLAARTGASRILVVLDTCHSGGGVHFAVSLADAVIAGRADAAQTWFGVIASARVDEPARTGAMASDLISLLTNGPSTEEMLIRWNPYKEGVPGVDLMIALGREWSEPRHDQHSGQLGISVQAMIRNPKYQPRSPDRVVEHLVQAARGSSSATENFFTGRKAIIATLVGRIRSQRAGLVLVTGPPGSGKSAILGRLVSLSYRAERANLLLDDLDPEIDPGPDTVDAHLHMRGIDFKTALRDLARQLNLDEGAGLFDVLALAARRHSQFNPLVVVVDGLDEAGEGAARDLAVRRIQPLAAEALVLLGTREMPGLSNEPSLIALLGPALEQIDLAMGIDQELADVHLYVRRRLADAPAQMDTELVANEVVALAEAANPSIEGPFLLARLITAQLRAEPLDTSVADWQSELATSVEAAFERDLNSVVLSWDDEIHATAGRELLRALACSYRNGFPADDVWPLVASALSPTGTTYTREHVYQLLPLVARYVVVSAEGDLAVYRIAHQRLVDHLRPTVGVGTERHLTPQVAVPIAQTITKLYIELLDGGMPATGHAYLWRHAWRHWADAGEQGREAVRALVARDRESFLEDLALVTDRQSRQAWWSGDSAHAVDLSEECVAAWRELGDDLDLAMALFDLSFTRSAAGDALGSEEAAAEAVEIARALGDSPEHVGVLAAALAANSMTQIRVLNADGATEMADQAIALIEPQLAEHRELQGLLSSAYEVQAQALMLTGQWYDAIAPARRAVELLEASIGEFGSADAAFVEALALQATSEVFAELTDAGTPPLFGSAPAVDAQPRQRSDDDPERSDGQPALERLLEILGQSGATGTIGDLPFAVALSNKARLLAARAAAGARDPGTTSDRRALLDRAAALAMPLADSTVEAAIILAAALLLRAHLPGLEGEPEPHPMEDLRDARVALLKFADSSPIASLTLGEVLLFIGIAVRAGAPATTILGGPDMGPVAALDFLSEAVERLDGSTNPSSVPLLFMALSTLLAMQLSLGHRDDSVLVAQRLVELARRENNGSKTAEVRLAVTLSDLGGLMCKDDPITALAAIDECAEILEHHGLASSPVFAYSLVNRGGAAILLGRGDEARTALNRAVTLLGQPSDAVGAVFLALALSNLAYFDLEDDNPAAAVEKSERSYAMLSSPGASGDPTLLTTARFMLARATYANGEAERAGKLFASCLDDMRERLNAGELSVREFAGLLNAGGGLMWDDVLVEIADQPELVRQLSLRRLRRAGEVDITVRELASALDDADTPEAMIEVRSAAREARVVGAQAFDDAWETEIGPMPDWLRISFDLIRDVFAWFECASWQQSKDHLASHPALLEPTTDVVLGEWIDPEDPDDEAPLHIDLLADVRERGLDEAYRSLIASEIAMGWLLADDIQGYLDNHREQLLGADVADWVLQGVSEEIPDAAMLGAMLVLVRRGEEELCLRLLDEPTAGMPLLQTARRATDTDRLLALTSLMIEGEDLDDEVFRDVAASMAIGHAIGGAHELAADTLRAALEESTSEDRDRIRLWITDAVGYHRTARDELLALLDLVNALDQDAAEDA